MSRVTISEFKQLARDTNSQVMQAPMAPSSAEQTFELDGGPMTSEPFIGNFIIIHSPVPLALAFGEKPEAIPTLHIMSAGDRFYGVHPGHRVSFVPVEE